MSGESAEQSARVVGGRYELEALIGKGGVGEVWRARHVALNSRVAIKFLQPASAQKESAKRRFTTEAQVTAQLKTPSAVQVFDFGVTDEGQPYLVMELLEGETLGLRLQRVKRLSVAETARVLAQAARALARAHQLGIVHRDFKPDNIVIYEDDEGREQVKVLDFGVAKLVGTLEEAEEGDDDGGARGDSSMFTRTGAVLGTPLYMAPEQIRDATSVDMRTDIWAFGVVAFECLTGRPPFTGSTLIELFQRIQSGLHASATFLEPSVPAGFGAWFEAACAPDPGKRFPNATVAWKQLVQALQLPGLDSSPSMNSALDANASSGERRVLVVREHDGADAQAPTLDRRDEASGELRGRTHDGGFASLQRISLDELPAIAPEPGRAPEPGPSAPPAPAGSRKGTWWMTAFAVVAVLGAVAVWRVAGVSSREVAPTAVAPSSVPSPPPSAAAILPETTTHVETSTTAAPPAALPPGSPSAASVVPPSPAPGARPVRRAPGAAPSGAPTPPAAPGDPPATAASAAPRAPTPTPTAAPADPGSYR